MFASPTIPTNPESLLIAKELLDSSNSTLANLAKFRREQFQRFWYQSRQQLRTRQDVNEILSQMDAASPGQSARFFASAKALVDLIEAISGEPMEPEEWMPPYEYTIDPETYSLRMTIPPEPESEPEPEPEAEPNE
ncbi:hypothetical protein VN12_20785 [Pirellula sp. SH-Sr6A]|uniref:hypothetical protein n=1 Tax=Pirellula sp. SH-Sr6A TaxID=1632865 RepID=UPI00078B18DC|nr:hypothetical protein [Pirellula sp. SH-Sr6A]AMV31722.1 hypothetical protein VN12_06345 [Pirellula sp. SH-Sr6A]AMV33748.1 hypothetical protein VN12_16585 [Pirellula sp. SH-Sr6A]AMV34573.1 hypothetical protein VN12_20785 [Pirellula sp. SH-Sr6A]